MPFKFDPSTFDALGRLAESVERNPGGALVVSVLVTAMILASGVAIAIARRSCSQGKVGRRRSGQSGVQ
jgi:hypothetical protein